LDLKKYKKIGSGFIKDVANVAKDQYEKRKDDYLEQKRIREEQEKLKAKELETIQKMHEIEVEKLSLEKERLRQEQQKMMMNNPMFSRELDQRATTKNDPNFILNAQFAKTSDEEFQKIINQLVLFEPEPIRDENQLQTQISSFLKGKFPDKQVVREEIIETGDRPDIIIDNKYVLEIKVPRDKSALRELLGQLDEYHEVYPDVCAVIFDDTTLELSETIREYAKRYLEKYDIPTVILRGKKREFKNAV
jgi:hypothetical protein